MYSVVGGGAPGVPGWWVVPSPLYPRVDQIICTAKRPPSQSLLQRPVTPVSCYLCSPSHGIARESGLKRSLIPQQEQKKRMHWALLLLLLSSRRKLLLLHTSAPCTCRQEIQPSDLEPSLREVVRRLTHPTARQPYLHSQPTKDNALPKRSNVDECHVAFFKQFYYAFGSIFCPDNRG